MAEELFITEEDVNGFRERLAAWGQELTDGERAILQMVLVRAFGPEADVEGFAAIVSPRDAASGQATGRRVHSPLTIVKTWDANTPLLLNTLIGTPYTTE